MDLGYMISLPCQYCGKETIVDAFECVRISAALKNPGDFHMIECPCGQSQFILNKRPAHESRQPKAV